MNMVPNYDIIFKLKVPRALNKPLRNGQMEPINTGIGVWVRSERITNENKRIQRKDLTTNYVCDTLQHKEILHE